jgi:hypothetical protein
MAVNPNRIANLPQLEVTSPEQAAFQLATEKAYNQIREALVKHTTNKLSLLGGDTLRAKERHSSAGFTEYEAKVDPKTGQITTASITRKDKDGQPTRPDCTIDFDTNGHATLSETWERKDGVKVYTTVDATDTVVTMVANNVIDGFNQQAKDKVRQRQMGQKAAHVDHKEPGRQDQVKVELKYDSQGKIVAASVATDKLAPMLFKLPFPYLTDTWFPKVGFQVTTSGTSDSVQLLPIAEQLGIVARAQWIKPEGGGKPCLNLTFETALNVQYDGEFPHYPIPSITIPEQIASGASALEHLRIDTSVDFAPHTPAFVKEQSQTKGSGGGFRPPSQQFKLGIRY